MTDNHMNDLLEYIEKNREILFQSYANMRKEMAEIENQYKLLLAAIDLLREKIKENGREEKRSTLSSCISKQTEAFNNMMRLNGFPTDLFQSKEKNDGI